MIKNILVGIDGSDHATTATRYATWLASRLDAALVGLHVVDIVSFEGSFFHDISGSLGFEPWPDLSAKMREALHNRGEALLDEFAARCRTAGVKARTISRVGLVATEICERARETDLVVIGSRGVNHRFSTGLLGSVTESVTRQVPRPILVTPLDFHAPRSPLLAYDGSERASAAMHLAAETCVSLGLPLTVLACARDPAKASAILDQARGYLEPYALEVTARASDGHAYEEIPARLAGGQPHDLVFMGSHGHGRIIELVLGSTTEYVLRNADGPIFLAR